MARTRGGRIMRFSRAVVYGPKTYADRVFGYQVVVCEIHNLTKKEKMSVVGKIHHIEDSGRLKLSSDLIRFLDYLNEPSPLNHVVFDSFIKAADFVGKAVKERVDMVDEDCPYLFHESEVDLEAN